MKIMLGFVVLITTVASALAVGAQVGIECPKTKPSDAKIVVKYNFFASEFGYYEIEGCQGVSPQLILAAGQEYTFIQNHISNWNHPLGFSYYPDGEDGSGTAMDHSKHNMGGTKKMDHSKHNMGGTTKKMDHSKHNMGGTTKKMDHSKHNMGGTTKKMDHSKHKMATTKMATTKKMDHSKHHMGGTTKKMDHSKHHMGGTTKKMDHSKHHMGGTGCHVDHSGHGHHAAGSLLGPTASRDAKDKCVHSKSCDTPHYGLGDKDQCENVYFDAFERPIKRWYGTRDNIPGYRVKLKIDQTTTSELFYFCHFHGKINGKIHICDRQENGECKKRVSHKPHPLKYYTPSSFDAKCGTADIGQFAQAKGKGGKCEGLEFLCGVKDQVSECFHAIDCAMNHGMRVHYAGVPGRVNTFMQQMIPHHQNAVDMAKVVLKDNTCDASKHAHFEDLLHTIVNVQNRQIQYMQVYLENAKAHSVEKAHCALPKARTGAKDFTSKTHHHDTKLVRHVPCEILPSNKASTEVRVSFNYFASEYGHFTVQGCAGVSPTLVLAADHEYRFIQQDVTNYYHPLGFSYDADGKIELKADFDPSGSKCAPHCQHAKYFMGDEFLGGTGKSKRGIEKYKQEFSALLIADWSGGGASSKHKWHARFHITDKYTPEVVYFDSLLPGLSGRIKICDLKASDKKCHPRARATSYFMDAPVKLSPLHKPSLYDQSCGTSNLSPFQPGKGYDKFCKGNVFMCSDEKNYDQFASCFDAVNCAMHDQMKVEHTGNCQELFINQMIPHHQNAVNMAKILLKFTEAELTSGGLSIPCAHDKKARCPDLDALGLLRSIIASQNSQIHFMRHYLATSVKGARATPSFCARRQGAVGATGLRIESPKAAIEFGPDGDVKLVRSNPGELTVEGGLGVSGSLHVENLKIDGMNLKSLIEKIVKEQK